MTILFPRMKKSLILNGIFLQTFAYWLFYFFPLYIINKNCAFVKFLILVTAVNEAQEIPKDVAIRFGQLACIKLLGGESGT